MTRLPCIPPVPRKKKIVAEVLISSPTSARGSSISIFVNGDLFLAAVESLVSYFLLQPNGVPTAVFCTWHLGGCLLFFSRHGVVFFGVLRHKTKPCVYDSTRFSRRGYAIHIPSWLCIFPSWSRGIPVVVTRYPVVVVRFFLEQVYVPCVLRYAA